MKVANTFDLGSRKLNSKNFWGKMFIGFPQNVCFIQESLATFRRLTSGGIPPDGIESQIEE